MVKSEGRRTRNRSTTWREGRPVGGGDLFQHAPSGRARAWKAPVTERAVSDHGHAVRLAPGDHRVLDRALPQMVEDLVADRAALARDPPRFLEIGHVEVAHAPGQDLAVAPELLECGDRVLERVSTAPVQEVASPAGRSRGARATARRPRSFRSATRSRGGPWRPGRPRRGVRRSPRRSSPRRHRTSPRCRCGSCRDRCHVVAR